MLILLMSLIVTFSTLGGVLLMKYWAVWTKVLFSLIGILPPLSLMTNNMRMPIPIEIELVCLFAGIFTGPVLIINASKLKGNRKFLGFFAGGLSFAASAIAGTVGVLLYCCLD